MNSVDNLGRGALHLCGLDPQSERTVVDLTCLRIAKILRGKGVNMSADDVHGMNAVHYSVVKGLPQLTTYLCEIGVHCDLGCVELMFISLLLPTLTLLRC